MELRFAHGPLQPEQEPVVEVAGVVDPVLVQDERLGERADLQKPVPIGRVARQPRDLQAHDDARAPRADLRHPLLKAAAVALGAGLAEIAVNHVNALGRPPERHGLLAQGVLARRALGILQHLAQGRLAHIQVGITLEVMGHHALGIVSRHGRRPDAPPAPSPRAPGSLRSLAQARSASPRTVLGSPPGTPDTMPASPGAGARPR